MDSANPVRTHKLQISRIKTFLGDIQDKQKLTYNLYGPKTGIDDMASN